jgi:hypothetical protein
MTRLGALLALIVTGSIAYVTTVVTIPACGENQEPCSATSGPVLAVALAWVGLAAVFAVVLLVRSGRSAMLAVVVTAAVYAAWLVLFVREVTDESPPSPSATSANPYLRTL